MLIGIPNHERSHANEAACTPITSLTQLAPCAANTQEHENEVAEVLIVCEPEQASLVPGANRPR